jgi:hypothetical protein
MPAKTGFSHLLPSEDNSDAVASVVFMQARAGHKGRNIMSVPPRSSGNCGGVSLSSENRGGFFALPVKKSREAIRRRIFCPRHFGQLLQRPPIRENIKVEQITFRVFWDSYQWRIV